MAFRYFPDVRQREWLCSGTLDRAKSTLLIWQIRDETWTTEIEQNDQRVKLPQRSSRKFVEKDGKFVMRVTRNVVVLNFFATYCIPCIREIPSYNRLYEKFRGKAVKMLYINVDPEIDQAKAQMFILKRKIKVPMMLPNQRQTVTSYQALALPRIVIINREGKIANIITGFRADLEKELSQLIEGLLKKGNT